MYATDWSEEVLAGEEERFASIAERLAGLKSQRDERYGDRGRAVHRRGHGGALGVWSVPDGVDLPIPLQVGPFRAGSAWQAWLRFSSGSVDRRRSEAPDVRGLAVKLVGVSGRKLLTGTEAPLTQDFLFNHTPRAFVRTPEEFMAFIEAFAEGELGGPLRLARAIGVGGAFRVLRTALTSLNAPFRSFGAGEFWSMVPFRLGPTAARYSLVPTQPSSDRGALDADLASHLSEGFAWDVRLQLYQDAVRTPIEDPTVDWDAPWIPVARLAVPATDETTAAAHAAYVERLTFDPWHAVTEMRPLGAMNRARKVAYYHASAKNRDVVDESEVA